MKTRIDFVSNSSSSSFICMPDDASNIALFNKSEKLSLHKYLEQFGERDFFPWHWYYKYEEKMNFVDDNLFSEMFTYNVEHTLPLSARDAYVANPGDWNAIMPYVEDVLKPRWGDKTFEYYEAEDCACYKLNHDANDSDDDYEPWDNEEAYLDKWFNSHFSMKFKRIFCNH